MFKRPGEAFQGKWTEDEFLQVDEGESKPFPLLYNIYA